MGRSLSQLSISFPGGFYLYLCLSFFSICLTLDFASLHPGCLAACSLDSA